MKNHFFERSRIWKSLVVVALSLVITGSVWAQEKRIIAVFDMQDKGSGLKPKVLGNLTDYLAIMLSECGFQVIPRDQIRQRIKSMTKASHKHCYDQACQIELGRELAAQHTLATSILKIADTCQVGAVLYDLRKAASEQAASIQAACNEKSLLSAVKMLAAKLCPQKAAEAAAPEKKPKGKVTLSDYPKVMLLLTEAYTSKSGEKKLLERTTIIPVIEDALLKKNFELVAKDQAEKLRKEGLELFSEMLGDNAKVAQVASKYGAEVAVVGNAEVKHTGYDVMQNKLHYAAAIVNIRAINVSSAKVLASYEAEGKSYGIDENMARSKAVKDAGPKVADNLMARLIQAWTKEATVGKRYKLIVLNVKSYGAYARPFIKALKKVPKVESVKELNYGGARLELEVTFSGTKDALMDGIFDNISIQPKFESLDKVLDRGDEIQMKL